MRKMISLVAVVCVLLACTARSQTPPGGKGLTEVQGIKVGHHTLSERPTGCTAILVDGEGAVGGVSQRGSAPGTRETDLLDPLNMVDKVNAVVLSGGSAGQRGDEGRNIVRGPGFARTDLSLFKNFALASTHQIQLRIEAFNVFNQERFGQPGNIVGSPTFGAITSADDGRIVQVGIKYTF